METVDTPAAPVHRTARARARAETTAAIVETARRHLAEQGAAALSLRAIARDLGMVSSALYRYFPSRDDLLTRLIVDAYDGLGQAVETAEARVPRSDHRGRFAAVCRAVRAWAHANPHEYALIYGSPVPGYRAPEATIGPATRVASVLVVALADAVAADAVVPPTDPSPEVAASMGPALSFFPQTIPSAVAFGGLQAFSALFGAVSFELFGQLRNVVEDAPASRQAFFDAEVDRLADLIGIVR